MCASPRGGFFISERLKPAQLAALAERMVVILKHGCSRLRDHDSTCSSKYGGIICGMNDRPLCAVCVSIFCHEHNALDRHVISEFMASVRTCKNRLHDLESVLLSLILYPCNSVVDKSTYGQCTSGSKDLTEPKGQAVSRGPTLLEIYFDCSKFTFALSLCSSIVLRSPIFL